jgi:hypothetical protein
MMVAPPSCWLVCIFETILIKSFNKRLLLTLQVLSSVRQDIVYWMEQHGKQYGYRLWDYDDPEVTWSLPEVTQWYLTANEIRPVSSKHGAMLQHVVRPNLAHATARQAGL